MVNAGATVSTLSTPPEEAGNGPTLPRTVETEESMDQHEGNRDSTQTPAKDFLALTHGQEWVSFYESFDLLVQDHLSRSSDLLRRAMSLPEVADREVAHVRAEMDGKLTAERERSHDLLSQLHGDIIENRDHVATLAASVQSVSAGLSSLSTRVAEALAALSAPAAPPETVVAEAPSESPDESLSAIARIEHVSDTPETAQDQLQAGVEADDNASAEAETELQPEVEAERVLTEEEEFAALLAEVEAEAAAEMATVKPSKKKSTSDDLLAEAVVVADPSTSEDQDVDLRALTDAEASDETKERTALSDDLVVEAERPQTGMLDEDAVGVGSSDRPRPHWLSVTRVGSRP